MSVTSVFSEDEKLIKKINYYLNGKEIDYIQEYDPSNGQEIQTTYYKHDGKTIKFITKYELSDVPKLKTSITDIMEQFVQFSNSTKLLAIK